MDTSTALPTPPATPVIKTLSPDTQLIMATACLHDIMDFIHDTGYSTCTEHCCKTIPATADSDDDCLLVHTVNLALTNLAIDCGRTIDCGLAIDCELNIDSEPVINTNGQQIQSRYPLDIGIDAAQSPTEIQRSVKLRQWGIEPILENQGTDIGHLRHYLTSFVPMKQAVEDRRGKHMNPSIYSARLAEIGPTRHERNTFAVQFSEQTTNRKFVQAVQGLKRWKGAVLRNFNLSILFSKPPTWLAYNVFWSRPGSGLDELSKAYLAWRKIWYVFVFCPRPVEELPRRLQNLEPELRDIIPRLQLWGSVQNDYTLFHYQELTRKDLRYTYEHEPPALRYMLENLHLWEDEVDVLNAYVGTRRDLSRDDFHTCKSAAQRTGSAMELVVRSEQRLATSTLKDNLELRIALEDHIFAARRRFLELKACIHGFFDMVPRRYRPRSNRVVRPSS